MQPKCSRRKIQPVKGSRDKTPKRSQEILPPKRLEPYPAKSNAIHCSSGYSRTPQPLALHAGASSNDFTSTPKTTRRRQACKSQQNHLPGHDIPVTLKHTKMPSTL